MNKCQAGRRLTSAYDPIHDNQRPPLALSWSGGKDSALALWVLAREHEVVPRALITTVTDTYERVSMHAVRRSLLALQASAVGVPLVEVEIPPGCTNEVYERRMEHALASDPLRDVEAVAFGDLFLEDVRRTGRTAWPPRGNARAFRSGTGIPRASLASSSPPGLKR